jgi:hypothetical protein
MNERIQELIEQATTIEYGVDNGFDRVLFDKEKFALLIIAECTGVLFDESEKLSALYSDEDNWQSAEEYEIRSNQCIDNIAVIEKHFGVEE